MPIDGGRSSDSYSSEIGKDARRDALWPGGFFVAYDMTLDFQKSGGLITAVIQDAGSGRVLMVGFMNDEAFRKTCETGFVTFYSRSRNKLWMKGESSGHRLVVKQIQTDCDDDTLLIQVDALGPGVCHAGYQSCFYRRLDGDTWVESEKQTYDPNAVYGGKQ